MFIPRTRKEVSKVEFIAFGDIQNLSSYGVMPLLPKLKKWVDLDGSKVRKAYAAAKKGKAVSGTAAVVKREKDKSVVTGHIDEKNTTTFGGGLSDGTATAAADIKGWGVGEMFDTNSKLTGRTFCYDGKLIYFKRETMFIRVQRSLVLGNPHDFGSQHPRYVNYNAQDYDRETTRNVSGVKQMGVTAPSVADLGHVKYFGGEFRFDVESIMKAVEDVLSVQQKVKGSVQRNVEVIGKGRP